MTRITTASLIPQNKFSTTLGSTCTSTDTTIYLNSLPTATEGFLTIDEGLSTEEVIFYSSKGSNFVTCPSVADGRGVYGSAVGHSSGASVKQKTVAEYFKALQDGTSLALGASPYNIATSSTAYTSPFAPRIFFTGGGIGVSGTGYQATSSSAYVDPSWHTISGRTAKYRLLVTMSVVGAADQLQIQVRDASDYITVLGPNPIIDTTTSTYIVGSNATTEKVLVSAERTLSTDFSGPKKLILYLNNVTSTTRIQNIQSAQLIVYWS